MVLTGYPVEDLALRPSFQEASRAALADPGRATSRTRAWATCRWSSATSTARRGRPSGSAARAAGRSNAAAVLHGGRSLARYAKHHLPNYGVFDEFRYFVPGRPHRASCGCDGVDVGPGHLRGPVAGRRTRRARCASTRAGLLLVVNGSPYERNKDDVRLELCARRAREAGCALAYVNMVGGQDELVFDGDSLVVGADGDAARPRTAVRRGPAARRPRPPGRRRAPRSRGVAEVGAGVRPVRRPCRRRSRRACPTRRRSTAALVTGLRDYVRKNGFRSVMLGLSGGIDSALVAAIAADALGAENVHGVSLPSAYSSRALQGRRRPTWRARTGCALPHACRSPRWSTRSRPELALTGLAEENLQARVRGMTLMAHLEPEGHLVLATGQQERALGGLLHDLRRRGRRLRADQGRAQDRACGGWPGGATPTPSARGETPPIPPVSIDKPPSAELRPGQLDTDSLPDYAPARRPARRLRREATAAPPSWSPTGSTARWSSGSCG